MFKATLTHFQQSSPKPVDVLYNRHTVYCCKPRVYALQSFITSQKAVLVSNLLFNKALNISANIIEF